DGNAGTRAADDRAAREGRAEGVERPELPFRLVGEDPDDRGGAWTRADDDAARAVRRDSGDRHAVPDGRSERRERAERLLRSAVENAPRRGHAGACPDDEVCLAVAVEIGRGDRHAPAEGGGERQDDGEELV